MSVLCEWLSHSVLTLWVSAVWNSVKMSLLVVRPAALCYTASLNRIILVKGDFHSSRLILTVNILYCFQTINGLFFHFSLSILIKCILLVTRHNCKKCFLLFTNSVISTWFDEMSHFQLNSLLIITFRVVQKVVTNISLHVAILAALFHQCMKEFPLHYHAQLEGTKHYFFAPQPHFTACVIFSLAILFLTFFWLITWNWLAYS